MESNKIFIVLKYIKVSIKKIATYMESNTIFIVRINEENLITFSCLFCEKKLFLVCLFHEVSVFVEHFEHVGHGPDNHCS